MKQILAFALLSLVMAFPVHADGHCMASMSISKTLKTQYGEVPVVTAMRKAGAPIIMFANLKTGTYTVVMVGPKVSCFIDTGTDLEIIMQGAPS